MQGILRQYADEFTAAAKMEDCLARSLSETANEVSRAECFDAEQRAEVYAILDALKQDMRTHRRSVGLWVNDLTGEACDV